MVAKASSKDQESKRSKAARSKDIPGTTIQNLRISKEQEYLTSELAKMKEIMEGYLNKMGVKLKPERSQSTDVVQKTEERLQSEEIKRLNQDLSQMERVMKDHLENMGVKLNVSNVPPSKRWFTKIKDFQSKKMDILSHELSKMQKAIENNLKKIGYDPKPSVDPSSVCEHDSEKASPSKRKKQLVSELSSMEFDMEKHLKKKGIRLGPPPENKIGTREVNFGISLDLDIDDEWEDVNPGEKGDRQKDSFKPKGRTSKRLLGGLINGNGLTNGIRRGLINGNGLTNGMRRGLINGNGLTNGMRRYPIDKPGPLLASTEPELDMDTSRLTNPSDFTPPKSKKKSSSLKDIFSISRLRTDGNLDGNGLTNGSSFPRELGGPKRSGLSRGIGLTNGNGLTNGSVIQPPPYFASKRYGIVKRVNRLRRERLTASITIATILLLPGLLYTFQIEDGDSIQIDGSFQDWQDKEVHLDTLRDTDNRNIDLVGISSHRDTHNSYLYAVFMGDIFTGNKVNLTDLVFFFVDTDGDPFTGYAINGIGADLRIETKGLNGELLQFRARKWNDAPPPDNVPRDPSDWNGFQVEISIVAATDGKALEIAIPNYVLEGAGAITAVSVDAKGNMDIPDMLITSWNEVLHMPSLQYPESYSDEIIIDGRFNDWVDVPSLSDTKDPFISPDTDIRECKLFQEESALSFWLRVDGTILEGGWLPLFEKDFHYYRNLVSGNLSSRPAVDTFILPELSSDDIVGIYIDTDINPSTGFQAGEKGAEYKIVVKGGNSIVHVRHIYEWNGGWHDRDIAVLAAANGSSLEVQIPPLPGTEDGFEVVIKTANWMGFSDFSIIPSDYLVAYDNIPDNGNGQDGTVEFIELAANNGDGSISGDNPSIRDSRATINGGSWGGVDLIPNDGDVLCGTFINVGKFEIPDGITVYVCHGVKLEIFAQVIYINGTLNGDGNGSSGGANGAPGNGPGGGSAGITLKSGGGGGGYGGAGGDGGLNIGSGGIANGELGTTVPPTVSNISMGSGGGCGEGSKGGKGGNGGGSVFLSATAILNINGTITVNGQVGEDGGTGQSGGGGGGSGGGISLYLSSTMNPLTITSNATLSVKGGDGGHGGNGKGAGGGGGAGGRIKIVYYNLDMSGTHQESGGLGGASGHSSSNPGSDGSSGTYHAQQMLIPEFSVLAFPMTGAIFIYLFFILHKERVGKKRPDKAYATKRMIPQPINPKENIENVI